MIDNLLLLKLIHVLSSTVLFGTGLGVAYFMLMACRTCDPVVVAHTAGIVVVADAVFIANTAIVQPISGVQLALSIGYSLRESWIVASFALYFLVAACWLPVLWLQVQMRNMARLAAEEGTALPELSSTVPQLVRAGMAGLHQHGCDLCADDLQAAPVVSTFRFLIP